MNKLKPFFMAPYLIGLVGAASYSIFQFTNDFSKLSWLIAMVSALTGVAYFIYIYTKYPLEVQLSLLLVTTITLISPVICLANYYFNNEETMTPLYITVFCVVGWLLYDRWYSQMPYPNKFKELLGKRLPSIEVEGDRGQPQNLEIKEGSYSILFFHRGSWCPFCVAQAREVARDFIKLEKAHTSVHLISPSRSPYLDMANKQFGTSVNQWGDSKSKASLLLGLSHKRGVPVGLEIFGFESDTTLPATIIVAPDRTIIFNKISEDYRKRQSLAFYLRIVEGHKNGQYDAAALAKR